MEKEAHGKGNKWRWYHGVLIYAGIQAATFGLAAIVRRANKNNQEDIKQFYQKQKQPIFAPPAWAFAPAWTLNNVLCIYGLLRVLNMPEEKRGRSEFLALQTASWANFALFSGASFGLRSNYNGAVLTNLYLIFTLASLYVAIEKLKDEKTALSLSTLVIWLGIASPLSLTIAAWNGDDTGQNRLLSLTKTETRCGAWSLGRNRQSAQPSRAGFCFTGFPPIIE